MERSYNCGKIVERILNSNATCRQALALFWAEPPMKRKHVSLMRVGSGGRLEVHQEFIPVRVNFLHARKVIIVVAALIFTGALVMFLQGPSVGDLAEIDSMLKSRMGNEPHMEYEKLPSLMSPKGIVLVGMVESLQILHENKEFLRTISSLCHFYTSDFPESGGGLFRIEILYKERGNKTNSNETLFQDNIGSGCTVSLLAEENLIKNAVRVGKYNKNRNRYQVLSWLRSLHRAYIIQKALVEGFDYEIVLNLDLDILSLPPVMNVIRAINYVALENKNGTGSIICANGYETWNMANLLVRKLFYDTFAAVDEEGHWMYTTHTTNPLSVLMFAQTSLLRDILRHKSGLWPMQSCFGGMAVYDYQTWTFQDCDYDRSNIKLFLKTASVADIQAEPYSRVMPIAAPLNRIGWHHVQPSAILSGVYWTVDARYTLSGTLTGDACEHVVLQQCLYYASHVAKVYRNLNIGIQPDLIVQRKAAILNRPEDYTRTFIVIGEMALALSTVILTLAFYFRKSQQRIGEFSVTFPRRCCYNIKYKA